MSPAIHFGRVPSKVGIFALVAAVLVSAFLALSYTRLPRMPKVGTRAVSAPAWPSERGIGAHEWGVFHARGVAAPVLSGSLAKRFRLAGTYSVFGGGTTSDRKAVLDDLEQQASHVVGEGDTIRDVTVVRIFRDRVVLRSGANEEQLWLSFSKAGTGAGDSPGADGTGDGSGAGVGATDRFGGKRIGEYRWVFKRQALLDYYTELMDEPDRLVQVFDSLAPLYDDERNIEGYQLRVEGEREFFESVGLQEGDIVRSVNSIEMSNRMKAEYLIKEFVADRANAFIFDVERDGKLDKLMYEVR